MRKNKYMFILVQASVFIQKKKNQRYLTIIDYKSKHSDQYI